MPYVQPYNHHSFIHENFSLLFFFLCCRCSCCCYCCSVCVYFVLFYTTEVQFLAGIRSKFITMENRNCKFMNELQLLLLHSKWKFLNCLYMCCLYCCIAVLPYCRIAVRLLEAIYISLLIILTLSMSVSMVYIVNVCICVCEFK